MSTAPVTDLVAQSADPDRVRRALERLVEVHPELVTELDARSPLAEALVAVLAASRSLGRLLVEDQGALTMLTAGAAPVPPPVGATEEVVIWKRRELLRIAAGDLARGTPVDTTTADLASMAATVLERAHSAAADHLAPDDRLAVIGMGKLGGSELNYASDVDLTLVGRGDPDRLERAGRAVLDHAGRSFRVDLDLRPEGRDGPLVRSLESYAAYWERWAQPWERQALLKAVPVAGDRELGDAWAGAAATVLWDVPFGADELRHVRAMKVRAEAEGRRRGGAERDVKRGPGGIRDVEFAAQLLQLVHGRVDADLRVPGTLPALTQLGLGGYVDPDDAAVLAGSYRFLRRVEHVLQLDDERQTHTVPEDRDRRRRVARVLGFRGSPAAGPTEAFDAELAGHRSRGPHGPRAGVVPAAAGLAVRRGPARRGRHGPAARRLRVRGRRAHPSGRQRAHPGPHPLLADDAAAPAPAARLAVRLAGSRPRPARAPSPGVGGAALDARWPSRSGTRRRSRATSPSCWARAASSATSSSPTPTSSSGSPTPSACAPSPGTTSSPAG